MTGDPCPDPTLPDTTIGGTLTVVGAVSLRVAPSAGCIPRFAYVGCRTTKERGARGEGISVYHIDPATGAWSQVQIVRDLVNPSFLAFDREQQFLYAVHGDFSEVTAFRIDPASGQLALLNRQSTGGRNPVHLTPDDANRFIIVANYATGSLAVMPRNADGSLGAVCHLERLPGEPNPNRADQSSSHPHAVAWDLGRHFIIVPDKGLDRIFTFRFDAEAGKVVPGNPAFVQVRRGAGPRHIAFHPDAPFAFVADELGSTVSVFSYERDRGELKSIQVLSSTPDTFTGVNTASEIEMHPSGRFVLVSNCGHDSVATFASDAASGRLTPVCWTGSEGIRPRFFAVDPTGNRIYVANENSDTIVRFLIDGRTGRLTREAEINTKSPVCIVFSTM
jgi:6-phosphogluconolactonase